MIIQNVKGGYDFLPKEQKIRNYINETLKETFEEYGYLPIETPILMYYDILSDKYDEESDILKEIYKLKDQGDRKLGLRYDLTVPFAKFIALNKNNIKMPFKRYEINKVFRDGPVKVGRDREFTQCDVDIVGLSGELIEAELVSLYVRAFNKLKIEIKIKYNSRKCMTGLILESGVKEDLVSIITTLIDKKDKITPQEFDSMLKDAGLDSKTVDKLISYFNLSLNDLKDKFKDTTNTKLKEGLEELNTLTNALEELNLLEYCVFDSSLARGQNYYTGNVFEVYEKNGKLSGSIGGGGRYDNMITNFINDGESYPAVGISFGLTSIYELLKNNEELKEESPVDIFIIPMETEIKSLNLANKLRDLGLKVELEMENKKLKKSLDYANKENIPYVIILGSDELEKQEFTLKDMKNRTSNIIKMNELNKIKEMIK